MPCVSRNNDVVSSNRIVALFRERRRRPRRGALVRCLERSSTDASSLGYSDKSKGIELIYRAPNCCSYSCTATTMLASASSNSMPPNCEIDPSFHSHVALLCPCSGKCHKLNGTCRRQRLATFRPRLISQAQSIGTPCPRICWQVRQRRVSEL